ncbi:MAG: glycosyltransferase family 4 protein, partial [Chroococcales cyanobacterium]
ENKGGTREKVPLFKGDLGGSFLQLDGEKNKFKKEAFVFAAGRVWDEAKNIGMLERIASQLLYPVYVAGNAKEPQKEEVNLKHNKRSPLTPLNKGGTRNPFKGDLGGSFPIREGGEICFLGRLSGEEMREWYRRAAVYALPAKYEPFGLSVLEAALSGCALVLGDIPSLRENWDGVAVFVSPEDAEGLVRAINDLIENQEKRWELARKCYDRALFFTSQRMAKGYINAYSTLIND